MSKDDDEGGARENAALAALEAEIDESERNPTPKKGFSVRHTLTKAKLPRQSTSLGADAGEAGVSRSRSLLGWGLRLGCVCSYVWLQSWARGMDTAQTLRLQLDAVASTPALVWKACSDCLSPAGAGCYQFGG